MTAPPEGLSSVLDSIRESAASLSSEAGIPTRFEFPPELPHILVAPHVCHQARLVMREALNNAIRHSGATQVTVIARFMNQDDTAPAWLELVVCDNGKGFKGVSGITDVGREGRGMGGMQQRLKSVGGYFEVRSAAGQGTELRILVPCLGIFTQ
jgi:signal transduction histidine kinase